MDHSMGMYSALMAEGVVPHYGLIGRDVEAGKPRNQPAGLIYQLCIYIELVAVKHLERHYDLLEARVSRPLPYPVYRRVELPRPGRYARYRVRYCETEVIMTMDAYYRVARYLLHGPHYLLHLLGIGHAYGIRDVQVVGPCIYHPLIDLLEELYVGPRGILGRKLHLDAVRLNVFNCPDGLLICLLPRDLELVLQMYIRSGYEHVDPIDARIQGAVYVGLDGPG